MSARKSNRAFIYIHVAEAFVTNAALDEDLSMKINQFLMQLSELSILP